MLKMENKACIIPTPTSGASGVLHIIVAAGIGSRFGADLPKQFVTMSGRPVIYHTVDAVRAACATGDRVVLVISPEMVAVWKQIEAENGSPGVRVLPVGGASRAATVANALRATEGENVDVITVHDGARPLLTVNVVKRLLEAARKEGSCGAIPVIPLSDSLRRLLPDGSSEAVDRSNYKAVQTPQVFPARILRHAYSSVDLSDTSLTDDASVVERFTGRPPEMVEGDPDNIKITHPTDLQRAELILRSRS